MVNSPTPIVNVGAQTYARVRYSPEQARKLAEGIGGLDTIDQLNLIDDSWALAKAGYAPAGNFL